MTKLRTKYMTRRETHSSRALVSTITALVLLALLVYLIAEAIASFVQAKALLGRPGILGKTIAELPAQVNSGQELVGGFTTGGLAILGIGIGFILIGLFLLGKAIMPGGLKRHSLGDERTAIVVDDSVLAADVSRQLRRKHRLDKGQVVTSVAAKKVVVKLTPTSGKPMNQAQVQSELKQIVNTWQLDPAVTPEVQIASKGVVGR